MLDHVAFGALDATVANVGELATVLEELTAEAEALMGGARRAVGEGGQVMGGTRQAVGEGGALTGVRRRQGDAAARGRQGDAPAREGHGDAAALTVTLGLGPGLLGDRFGLAARRPMALLELPSFPGDDLDPALCGGDLCVQACATDPGVAKDALARITARVRGGARLRWSQAGSVHRGPNDRPDGRPRNLLGFREGISNPRRGKDFDRHVWAARGERTWMVGGTFLAVRRIEVDVEAWEGLSLAEQERVIGRHRDSGASLGAKHEFDRMPLDGDTIAPDAHARLATPRSNEGAAMLRRAYSYDHGTKPDGRRDAGLLLLVYQRDPRRQFVPVQRRLAEHDALSRFSRPVGSAVFAIPPGTRRGGFVADRLLDEARATARTSAR